jgi:hypothetical protein
MDAEQPDQIDPEEPDESANEDEEFEQDADEVDVDDDDDDDDDDDEDEGHPEPEVTIEVSGLSLYTHMGVTEAERQVGQRLIVDLRIDVGECDATAARFVSSSTWSPSSANTARSSASAPLSPIA